MGIYDRDYYRSDSSSPAFFSLQTIPICKILIAINVFVFFLHHSNLVPPLDQLLGARGDSYQNPAEYWKWLSYAFVQVTPAHLLLNMVGLYLFGKVIEVTLGSKEFLAVYLLGALLSCLAQIGFDAFFQHRVIIGASGAVLTLMAIYAVKYPKSTLLLGMVIPVTAWHGLWICAAIDVFMTFNPDYHVATFAHLGGMAWGLAYTYLGIRLTRFWAFQGRRFRFRFRRPKLKVVHPGPVDDEIDNAEPKDSRGQSRPRAPREREADSLTSGRATSTVRPRTKSVVVASETELDEQLDVVLAKIAREGRESLNEAEQNILDLASQRARDRRDARWRSGDRDPGKVQHDRR